LFTGLLNATTSSQSTNLLRSVQKCRPDGRTQFPTVAAAAALVEWIENPDLAFVKAS
jgi:hypothetical protein